MRKLRLALIFLLVATAPVSARLDVPLDPAAVAGSSAMQSVISTAISQAVLLAQSLIQTDYLGKYSYKSLPDPVANDGKRVLATDLGGGPGYLRATNGCWVRVSTATAHLQPVSVNTTVNVDGLANSPIVYLTGSAFAGKAMIVVTNACSMPQITVDAPNSVFTAAGSLGISTSGNAALSVLGIGVSGVWGDFAVNSDGSVTKIKGGSL